MGPINVAVANLGIIQCRWYAFEGCRSRHCVGYGSMSVDVMVSGISQCRCSSGVESDRVACIVLEAKVVHDDMTVRCYDDWVSLCRCYGFGGSC